MDNSTVAIASQMIGAIPDSPAPFPSFVMQATTTVATPSRAGAPRPMRATKRFGKAQK